MAWFVPYNARKAIDLSTLLRQSRSLLAQPENGPENHQLVCQFVSQTCAVDGFTGTFLAQEPARYELTVSMEYAVKTPISSPDCLKVVSNQPGCI